MNNCCSVIIGEARTTITTFNRPKTSNSVVNHQKSNRFIKLKGGIFTMGTNGKEGYIADGEGPARKVEVENFSIGCFTVTNEAFKEFVVETEYVTDAERYGWSFVFHLLLSDAEKRKVKNLPQKTPWWCVVEGASWKKPEGPDSSIENRMNHPVVHVSWNDAMAFCEWAQMRLPTEAEWEYAARGGLEQKIYPWGNNFKKDGAYQCNIWQGRFPIENNGQDGYILTAPVDAYFPNGYGLYNVVGNVWEWCADSFSLYHTKGLPKNSELKVMKGGSYLCHESYCNRYRVAARIGNTPDSSSGNMGFRCVKLN